jgi:hypothetical protein
VSVFDEKKVVRKIISSARQLEEIESFYFFEYRLLRARVSGTPSRSTLAVTRRLPKLYKTKSSISTRLKHSLKQVGRPRGLLDEAGDRRASIFCLKNFRRKGLKKNINNNLRFFKIHGKVC